MSVSPAWPLTEAADILERAMRGHVLRLVEASDQAINRALTPTV
jgi:hypothetical protein